MLSEAVQVSVFEFLSAIIVGAAWPAVAGILVWQQRAAIGRLIDRFRALGFGDLKANFDGPMASAEALTAIPDTTPTKVEPEASEMTSTSTSPTIGSTSEPSISSASGQAAGSSTASATSRITFKVRDPFKTLASIDPRSAISQVWSHVQRELDDINLRTGAYALSNEHLLSLGILEGFLSAQPVRIYRELNSAFAASAADPDLDASDAVRFKNSADSLMSIVSQAVPAWEASYNERKLRQAERDK